MTWRVRVDRAAAKKLKRLDIKYIRQIADQFSRLAINPRPPGSLQLKDSNVGGWRIRIGKYRVLYTINDDSREVVVYDLGLRDQVYKKRK